MKELFQLSFRCTKLKCGVIWAFVVMSAPGPWRERHLGPAACRAPCEKPSRGGCSFLSCRGHSCQVGVLYPTLGFFFCKVAGKKSLVAGCVFLGLFYKIWLLVRKIWQATSFLFIYVRRILQYIDWHSVCSQLIANQCNNIRAVELFAICSRPHWRKSHSERRRVTL